MSAEVTWRPVTASDAAGLAGLVNEAERVDRNGTHVTPEMVADELGLPGLDPATDTLVAALADGTLVGLGYVYSPPTIREWFEPHTDATIHPEWRGRGLGRRILSWQVDRAARMWRERHPDAPGRVRALTWAGDEPRKRLLTRAGFGPIRWWSRMVRDLAQPSAEAAVPAEYAISPWDTSRREDVRLAHNDAFADHWGSRPVDERMWDHVIGQPGFRGELSYMAVRDDHVAAYLLTTEPPSERAVTVSYVGTRREHRGRGLAGALLSRALIAYREAGYATAHLDVDSGNETGALGLYERAGFTVDRVRTVYARDLPAIVE